MKPPKNSKTKTRDEHDGSNDSIKDKFEIVGIVFGVIGVIVLIWQTVLLRGSNRSTAEAVRVSKEQTSILQRQTIVDARAWVSAEQHLEIGKSLNPTNWPTLNDAMFIVRIKNFGQTPARCLDWRGWLTTDTNMIPDHDVAPQNLGTWTTTLPPGEEVRLEIGPYYGTNLEVYVYGTIWYEDIFKYPHWSEFCTGFRRLEDGSGESFPLAIHNSCDDVVIH